MFAMARRRRNESLVEVALTARWTVAAGIAFVVFVVGYLFLPAMLRPSPLLAPAIEQIRGIFGLVALVFAGIALVKFLIERVGQSGQPKLRLVEAPIRFERSPVPQASQVDQAWHDVLGKEAAKEPALDTATWSMGLVQAVEWKRYEDLCAAFYREMGIRSETTPLGADGGIDIRLYQEPDNPKSTAVVQCKAWGDKLVGVKPVRELLGVITHEKIPKAFFMAPGGFTDDAREFAKTNNITLLDGKLFLAMLQRLPTESSRRLLALATEGDFTTPSCPSCGTKMLRRTGSRGDFWGCRDYPRCKRTMPMRKTAA
jgi:restriction system protein